MKLKPKMIKKIKLIQYSNGNNLYIIYLYQKYHNLFESFSKFYMIPVHDCNSYIIDGICENPKTKNLIDRTYTERGHKHKKYRLRSLKKIKFTDIKDKAKFKLYY